MKLPEKKIRWIVTLGEGGEVLVKKGDKVKVGQLLARYDVLKVDLYGLGEVSSRIPMSSLRLMVKDNEGMEVVKDALLGTRRKMFGSSRWLSPGEGKVLGIDEFGNLMLERIEGKKQIESPVAGKVVRVEKTRLVLEFKAVELKGEALAEGKNWGISDFEEIEKWIEVTFDLKDKVIWVRKPEAVILTKAGVMGVAGIVCAQRGDDEIKSDIPVIKIDEKLWETMVSEDREPMRVWINSKKERLLLMLE